MVEALLDIGASTCFMDNFFSMKHNIVLVKKAYLASGNVVEETKPLEVILKVSCPLQVPS